MDGSSRPPHRTDLRHWLESKSERTLDLGAVLVVAAIIITGSWLLLGGIQDNPLNPPPLLALGLLLLAAALVISFKGFVSTSFVQQHTILVKRVTLLALTVPLLVYVLQRIPILGRVADYMGVFLAWALAVLIYGIAFIATKPGLRWPAMPRWRLGRRAAFVLIAITLGAALVRLWDLGSIPYIFQGDEAAFSLEALDTTTGVMKNPFATGWLSQPTMGMFFEGLSLRLTGATIEGARILWAVLGILTVPVTFFLASRIRGTTVGLVTAALLAVYHFHIHYSRTALNNIADPLFLALAILFLINAVERKSLFSWALVGASCGLALYFYQGARLTPLVLVAALIYVFIRQDRRFRRRLALGPVVAVGAFLVVAAPMLQFALRYPDDFNSRVNQISVFQPGWLDQEIARTGLQGYQIMWNQLTHAALAFNVYADNSGHYQLPTPLLDPGFGLLFLVGLASATLAALAARNNWRLVPLVVWWWSGMVVGGALTFSPPASQRLITLAVPVCFFIALALDLAVRSLRQLRFMIPLVPTQAACVLLFAAFSLKTYFIDYTPLHLAGTKTDDTVMALLPELRALEPQSTVFFAGDPMMYWKPAPWQYLVPQAAGSDLPELTGPPPTELIAQGQQALFVFLPNHSHDLDYVQQTFSNGTIQTIVDPVDEQVLATLYKVTR